MTSKPLILAVLATACMTAAAGGAYVAVRQNEAARAVAPAPTAAAAPAPTSAPATPAVAETEAVVTPAPVAQPESPRKEPERASRVARREEPASRPAPRTSANGNSSSTVRQPVPEPAVREERPVIAREPAPIPTNPAPTTPVQPEPALPEAPPAPPKPRFVEVVVPSSSVVGLQLESSVSSETAQVEDRVDARVTRDVIADGRVAVRAGSRAIGDVVLVDRGGKMKGKSRIGVRFHTLVLADGSQVPFRTDAIYREGASPGAESAKKIGGAAIGGAVLGAIIGGAKGAAIGGAAGAAGGSTVVMAGERNAAVLTSGTVVTVRLSSPLTVDVEREEQSL